MLIVGKCRRLPIVGYGAEFCPICRDIKEFRVREVRLTAHIFFIPTAGGRRIGYCLECLVCRCELLVDENPILALETLPPPSLEAAIVATNPNLREEYDDRLEIEKAINQDIGLLSSDLRENLIYEPFEELAPEMERVSKKTHFDRISWFGIIGTLTLSLTMVWLVNTNAQRLGGVRAANELSVYIGLAILAGGTIFTVWQLHRSGNRAIKRQSVPLLQKALAPLNPSPIELENVLDAYRADDFSFPNHLRPADLIETFHQGE